MSKYTLAPEYYTVWKRKDETHPLSQGRWAQITKWYMHPISERPLVAQQNVDRQGVVLHGRR